MPKINPTFKDVRHLFWRFSEQINDYLADKFGDDLSYNEVMEIVSDIDEMQYEYADKLKEIFGEED